LTKRKTDEAATVSFEGGAMMSMNCDGYFFEKSFDDLSLREIVYLLSPKGFTDKSFRILLPVVW
jgi:hypothetical protein